MSKEILDSSDINRAIRRMSHEIIEKNKGMENLCLVGIQQGGVTLAEKLASQIESIEGGHIEVGTLDISFRLLSGPKSPAPLMIKPLCW
jgi:pyrimidine operon attenuation protein/uracil phosphoribosyltransferase